MKSLFLGVFAIIVIGVGGFIYRSAVEHPTQPITCPVSDFVCPDGTRVSRTGSSCVFSACLPPNVSLSEVGISFAVPEGFVSAEAQDVATIAAYESSLPSMSSAAEAATSSTKVASIIIRRFAITASSTALGTIQQTAIGGASGLPVSATAYSSSEFGTRRFSVVLIERFEGTVDTAYYLARPTDVLRFDAVDANVMNWTDKNLDTSKLPAHAALRKLLATLQEG